MPEKTPAPSAATTVERESDRALVVRRTFAAPARQVFEAWRDPDAFISWWVPKAFASALLSHRLDVREGGSYRLEFRNPESGEPMAFFGTYKEVIPNERIVWTNEESYDGALTTVTFVERDGKTLVTYHERYPSSEALEDALAGSAEGLPGQFSQLDDFLSGRA